MSGWSSVVFIYSTSRSCLIILQLTRLILTHQRTSVRTLFPTFLTTARSFIPIASAVTGRTLVLSHLSGKRIWISLISLKRSTSLTDHGRSSPETKQHRRSTLRRVQMFRIPLSPAAAMSTAIWNSPSFRTRVINGLLYGRP